MLYMFLMETLGMPKRRKRCLMQFFIKVCIYWNSDKAADNLES